MRFIIFSISLFSFFLLSFAHADDFILKTSAFSNLGRIPELYTCDNSGQSPDLSWRNPPAKTKNFALIVSDPDAPSGTFYHWVMYNIPSDTKQLTRDMKQFPAGTLIGNNSFGTSGYKGPCPPTGAIHRYIFTLYALDSQLNLPADSDVTAVLNAMKGHILKQTQIMGTYSRRIK